MSSAAPSTPSARGSTAGNQPELRRGNILVVDDEPLTGAILSTWLREKGYHSLLASSPEEADRLLISASVDLVISDVYMPGNFRLEWVERLLKRASTPPVLLVTGTPDLETACRAANLPVAGYLLKPFDFSALDEVIQRVLQEQFRRRDFASVAQEVIDLLTSQGTENTEEENALVRRLADYCTSLRTQPGRVPAGHPGEETWRTAITETIGVLEKTKHSFRSKELGGLRQRLQRLLAQNKSA